MGIIISQIIYGTCDEYFRDQTYFPFLYIAIAAFSLHFGVFPLTFCVIPEIIPEKVI